jgi:hypothetical protein
MVARRADKGKTMIAVKGAGHRPYGGTRSTGCHFEGLCGDIGVMVDKVLAPVHAELTDHADVRRSMDAQKVINGRCMWFLYFNAGRDTQQCFAEPDAGLIMRLQIMLGEDAPRYRPAPGHDMLNLYWPAWSL